MSGREFVVENLKIQVLKLREQTQFFGLASSHEQGWIRMAAFLQHACHHAGPRSLGEGFQLHQ